MVQALLHKQNFIVGLYVTMTIPLNHNKLSFKCVSKVFPCHFLSLLRQKSLNIFQAYLNEDVVNIVVNETNSYYKYCVEKIQFMK